MDLTSSDTVLPRPLPSATNLSPFLYESTGGRGRVRKQKTRKQKTRRNKRGHKKRTYRRRR